MAEVIKTADEFQTKVLEAKTPVLVDFFATWCGPCRMVAPVIDEIATEKAGQVAVYKVDIRSPACRPSSSSRTARSKMSASAPSPSRTSSRCSSFNRGNVQREHGVP